MQDTPPAYNLSNVNAPVYLFYSDADWLADTADIQVNVHAYANADSNFIGKPDEGYSTGVR